MNGPKVEIAALEKSDQMLEHPVDPVLLRTAVTKHPVRTISRKDRSRKRERNPQRPYVGHPRVSDEEMVPTAWRHAAMTSAREVCRLSALLRKVSSEIPCRVSSDPHERRNDLAAVSRRDPAKLRYP